MKVASINILIHVSQNLPSSELLGGLFKCKTAHKETDEGEIPRTCDRNTQNMDGKKDIAGKLEPTRKNKDWSKHSGIKR